MEWLPTIILMGICFSALSLLLHMYEVPEEPLKIRYRIKKNKRNKINESR